MTVEMPSFFNQQECFEFILPALPHALGNIFCEMFLIHYSNELSSLLDLLSGSVQAAVTHREMEKGSSKGGGSGINMHTCPHTQKSNTMQDVTQRRSKSSQ